MFTWIINKIKVYGVAKAIDALDNLEKPLGDRITLSIQKFNELDGYGIAVLMIDEVQSLLRSYFKIEAPKQGAK